MSNILTPYAYPTGPIIGPAGAPQDKSGDSVDVPYLGIYTSETTQRFMLGTRYITWDGRVFKYCLAGSATVDCEHGAGRELRQSISYNDITKAQAIGDYEAEMDVGTTDGDRSGNIATDEMAGGYLLVFDNSASNAGHTRGIVGNDAVVTGATNITLDLDMPWDFALTTDDDAEAICSPYYKLHTTDTGYLGCGGKVCVPVKAALTTEFFWGQTWGPCWISPQDNFGISAMKIGGVFRHDGSVDNTHNFSQGDASYTDNQQNAGFVLSHGDGSQAAPFMMLQISI